MFNYDNLKLISTSNISLIFTATKNNKKYIIKSINNEHFKYADNEIKILKYLSTYNSDNIQKLVNAEYLIDKIVITLEYIEGIDLYYYAENIYNNKNLFDINTIYDIFYQMALSIYNIHFWGIVHNDIKLENFIYGNNKIYLIDFGLSTSYVDLLKNILDLSEYTFGGTINSVAPEIIKRDCKDLRKADIYSLGVAFFNILYFSEPYYAYNKRNFFDRDSLIDNRGLLINDNKISFIVKDLILSMLDINPEKRPEAHKVLTTMIKYKK